VTFAHQARSRATSNASQRSLTRGGADRGDAVEIFGGTLVIDRRDSPHCMKRERIGGL
jgi:hypothetical protein